MGTKLYYGIPAYNEEENLPECLRSLAEQDIELDLETIVCLNGCTDNTERIIDEAREKHPRLNIRTVHSEKGISYAHNTIARSVDNREVPLVFVDADVTLDRRCIGILYEEMARLDRLIVVGGWPIPQKPEKMSSWEKFLYEILHVRAFYPESEISQHDVSEFKNYVRENPQPSAESDFEIRSKIYFHGRTFMMRNVDFFEMPEDKDITDDTYLPNTIHTKYGPGTIRTRFDALVYYKPYLSLREHFRTYRRVFLDKLQLDQRFKEFGESRFYEETKLDWKFIFSQDSAIAMQFLVYSLIKNSEEIAYRLLPKDKVSNVWNYDKK
jgi:glycosyltransferase involved in cell wall biosynthesis